MAEDGGISALDQSKSQGAPASVTPARWPSIFWWSGAGLILAMIPAVIFPGDAPFVNDEPLLIISALDANLGHQLALHGLPGNRGLLYGPLPTWLYQVMLFVTHDPVGLVIIHSMTLSLGIVVALAWLARGARLWPPFAVVLALAPQVWFQTRQLWDNTFNIPICALVLAAYVHFLVHRSRAALAGAVAGIVVAPFVHPMALAFSLPVALHMLVFERRSLWQHAAVLVPFPIIFLLLSGKYLRLTLHNAQQVGRMDGAVNVSQGFTGFAFPLFGGRFLSAEGFFPASQTTAVTDVARTISSMGGALVLAGLVLAAWRVASVLRGRRELGIQEHVAILALGIVAAQSLLDGVMKVAFHIHYFNATWIAYALLAWFVADALVQSGSAQWRALGVLVPLYGVALAVVAFDFTLAVHRTPGAHFGLTVSQQAEVAREVLRYGDEVTVTSDLYPYKDFPHALTAMKRLVGTRSGQPLPGARLAIRLSGTDPANGRVEVVVAE